MQLNNFFKEMYYVRFASNKNNQKVAEEQEVWRGTNCYVKISLINLKVSAICKVQQYPNVKVSWGQIEACLRKNSTRTNR